MKIVNYDTDIETALKCLPYESFILDAVRHLELQIQVPQEMDNDEDMFTLPVRFFKEPRLENIANLIHTIPIFLCNDANSTSFSGAFKECDGDELGAYHYYVTDDDIINKSPYIALYPKAIFERAKPYEKKYGQRVYKWLLTIALLHELGHAALDIRNCSGLYKSTESFESEETHKKQEECMANAIALRIIYNYKSNKDWKEFHKFTHSYCDKYISPDYFPSILDTFNNADIAEYVKGKVK